MATSVPVPIAMPTSACASAGASLMPSPAIATTRPLGLQALHLRELLLGQHVGDHLGDRQRRARRPPRWRDCRRSASRRAGPRRPDARSASRRAGLDRIGDAEQARQPAVDGDEHHRLRPRARSASARAASASAPAPTSAISARFPTATRRQRDAAGDALPGQRLRTPKPPRRATPRSRGARDDRRAQRVLAAALDRRREPQQVGFAHAVGGRDRRTSRGFPSVSVPVLSTTSVSTLPRTLDRLRVLEQHARAGALAGRDHDRHRRRQPQRARAGDDQHRDRVDQRVRQPRRRARPPAQTTNVTTAATTTAGTKTRDTASASFWIGARLRCASPTMRTICASSVSAPTRSARITTVPVPLIGAADRRDRPAACATGHRLARDHRLVDAAARPPRRRRRRARSRPGGRAGGRRRERPSSGRPPRRRRRARAAPRLGASPSSARIAAPVRPRARSSSTCPSSTSVTMTAAGSK